MSLEAQQIVDSADNAVTPLAAPSKGAVDTHPANHKNHLKDAAVKAYTRQTKKIRTDKLIIEFLPMVHRIVHQAVSFLRPPLSNEDLVSAGTIGLVKAARDYDPSKDAEFKTYAYIRVRGAVLDELRSWSFAPATVKKQFERARQLARQITKQTGKPPSERELAEKLGISVEKMYKLFEDARARHFLSMHGMTDETPPLGSTLADAGAGQPAEKLEHNEMVAELTKQIQQLPEKQRKVIILYYHKELTMKQIAQVLNVTESRVSQLHASALFRLSNKLRQWDDTGY